MGYQSRLVLLSVILAVTLADTTPKTPNSIHEDGKDINELPLGLNPRYNKMVPPGKNKLTINTAPPTSEKKQTTRIPLAEDPRFNKMLPETNHLRDESTDASKKDDNNYYDNYDNYDYDDYYDEPSSNKNKTKDGGPTSTEKAIPEGKLKPIKGDDKDIPPNDSQKSDTDEMSDENDDDDDIDEEEEIIFNENVPCPRDCICARNVNSYLVATCSRLDADVQKFGSDITDLIVVDVGPKYPILLGPEFFKKIGLKHVSSIKIANCTIEYIHPAAFHGLEELYAVNLTNVALSAINPDTFAENKRLRLLTISGNDLSEITRKGSPNSRYLLKSSSVEELDLSNNNLKQLHPNSFNELSNIIYINLAQNNLKELPDKIFDSVETIEELDLSYNNIKSLPQDIFNKTALAILHLKYNDISNDLKFGTADLQQLDLSYCSIKHINNHMFNKMEGLTNLNLKGNGLTKIQPDSFNSLRNLRHIDLSMNDLDQVSSLLFYKNPELDVIRLNDNPRLNQLPPDGFQSHRGTFNVYFFDVSNCAIGPLGHKTFATMPRLTTLKLAWNNINNLEKGTFIYSDKLTELDLSNNLIVRLDELMFLYNRDLTKLNLAGNPIKKLSAKLFLPLSNLKELDVSECELTTLLADNYFGVQSKFGFYESLRTFNASFNQIKKVSKDDIKYFTDLKTLDISNNPLKCNEDFKGLMKWLGKKGIVAGKVPTSADSENPLTIAAQTIQTWDELARSVCKRAAESFKPPTDILNSVEPTVTSKKEILNEAKEDIEEDTSLGEDADEDDGDEEDDGDDYDEYDDEDQDEEVDVNENQPIIKDKGIFAEQINIIKETKDKFLRGKLGADEDDDDDEDEEIIIERGRIYYSSYRFLWPMLIIIFSVVILLLVIARVVSLLMRKRGERYRQALLASKNSIVYQKLSEEIPAPRTIKSNNGYALINHV